MQANVNFGEIEGCNYLPVGNFECKCIYAKFGRSLNKGTLYLSLTWECGVGDHTGKTVTERHYITEKTAWRFKGWSDDIMNVELTSNKINENIYKNRYALVTVYKETYNDKEYTKCESKMSEQNFSHNKHVDGSTDADVPF